jgi:predicted RNase H-like nuclease (RuvC/YqgF family)
MTEDLNTQVVRLTTKLQILEEEIPKYEKEIQRITKAFIDLQSFYESELSKRLKYEKKLKEIGVKL